jgi:arabinoxylan arabinofuranohydrolase
VDGRLIGTVDIPSGGGREGWFNVTAEISGVQGVHDLYMVFRGKRGTKLFDFDYWQFIE